MGNKQAKYKIVAISNFGDKSVSDVLVCENISSLAYAKIMANALNNEFSSYISSKYFRVTKQGYKLHIFKP